MNSYPRQPLYLAASRPSLSSHFQTPHCLYQRAPANPLAAPECYRRRRYSPRAERQYTSSSRHSRDDSRPVTHGIPRPT